CAASSWSSVARPVQQILDYLAAEPIRVSAILRLPLIGLIAVLVWIWEVDHWLPGPYAVILGVYAVVAVLWHFLLWLAVAVTALCYVLTRRSARVKALQEMRRQLVSEAMQSDERHNREVAEHLHDGPLETPLAARLELDEARERNPDPALDMVYSALQETAIGLRSTVTELHPQVLA